MEPDPTGGQGDTDEPFLSIEEVLCGAQSSTSDLSTAAPPPPPSSLPPPLPLAPAESVLPLASRIQADSGNDTLESIGPGSSAEKADTDDGYKQDGDRTATGALGVPDPLKRTAEDAGLNEGSEGVSGSGNVRRKGQSAGPGRSMLCLTVL